MVKRELQLNDYARPLGVVPYHVIPSFTFLKNNLFFHPFA